eukprot:comp4374_c0_seq1/m.2925 comp4374_c0_seq1/g.2925  ORF comp4374_c0_seq1/g.2925 comp4374_c0_seq1/m.2925 type:complete len:446 (-) comp4374_c0_seq1:228-1565(-)
MEPAAAKSAAAAKATAAKAAESTKAAKAAKAAATKGRAVEPAAIVLVLLCGGELILVVSGIVLAPLIVVGQDIVCFADFLEVLLGILLFVFAGVLVRVPDQRLLPVCLFDLGGIRGLCDAEDLVVVFPLCLFDQQLDALDLVANARLFAIRRCLLIGLFVLLERAVEVVALHIQIRAAHHKLDIQCVAGLAIRIRLVLQTLCLEQLDCRVDVVHGTRKLLEPPICCCAVREEHTVERMQGRVDRKGLRVARDGLVESAGLERIIAQLLARVELPDPLEQRHRLGMVWLERQHFFHVLLCALDIIRGIQQPRAQIQQLAVVLVLAQHLCDLGHHAARIAPKLDCALALHDLQRSTVCHRLRRRAQVSQRLTEPALRHVVLGARQGRLHDLDPLNLAQCVLVVALELQRLAVLAHSLAQLALCSETFSHSQICLCECRVDFQCRLTV